MSSHTDLASLPAPRCRIAPSPTGRAHIGTARTALYSWLHARQNGGSFIVRIEDTDAARNEESHVQEILDDLAWLGLDWDAVVRQSDNAPQHKAAIDKLLASGFAYRDGTPAETVRQWKADNPGKGYRGTPASEGVVMLALDKVFPGGVVEYEDLLRGTLSRETAAMHDEVLARADGSPLYNLAVVVDDHDAAITHVVRGDDHLTNTFRQVAIGDALDYGRPVYAHLALIHDEDGKKYSKRKAAPGLSELREAGFPKEAVMNSLALLGWGPRDDNEILDKDALLDRFVLGDCGTSAARLDPAKMRHFSGHYLRHMPAADYAQLLADFTGHPNDAKMQAAAAGAQEKGQTLPESWKLVAWAFEGRVEDAKSWKKQMKPEAVDRLIAASRVLSDVVWTAEDIENALHDAVEEGVSVGKLYQPLRVAVTGLTVSTGIGHTLSLAPRQQVLDAIAHSVDRIRSEN